MKKTISVFCALLAVILLFSSLPLVQADAVESTPKYGNSFLLGVESEAKREYNITDFPLIENLSDVAIVKMEPVETGYQYLLLMVIEKDDKELLSNAKIKAEHYGAVQDNCLASDYANANSFIVLNHDTLELKVGETAKLEVVCRSLVSNEYAVSAVQFTIDPKLVDEASLMESGYKDWGLSCIYSNQEPLTKPWFENVAVMGQPYGSPNEVSTVHCYYTRENSNEELFQIINTLSNQPGVIKSELVFSSKGHVTVMPGAGFSASSKGIVDVQANDEWSCTLTALQPGETIVMVRASGGGVASATATCKVTVVEANPESPSDVVFGDPTGDRKVDAKDALQVLKYAVQKAEFTPLQMLAAEVDGKDGINAKDALEILKYAVRKIEKFPIELLLSAPPTDIPSTPTDVPIDPNTPTDTPENPEPPVDEPVIPEKPSTPTDTPTPPVEEPSPPLENPDEKIVGISSVNFPDRYFNLYVRLQYDLNEDGWLSAGEIAEVTEMNIANEGVITPAEQSRDNVIRLQSVKGIEYFTNLETLFVGGNELTQLDISSLTKLRYLNCTNNQLTSLDVSKNLELTDLHCNGNQLTQLNISNNLNLIGLNCNNNLLAQLDVSANGRLKTLYCESNQIKELQLANNPNLWILHCENNLIEQLDLTNNPKVSWLDCDETVTVIR